MNRIKKFLALPLREKNRKIKNYLAWQVERRRKPRRWIPDGYAKPDRAPVFGPKVSVLMPVYNHAGVVLSSLDSILAQTYSNLEIILLDDGSQDGLLEKLEPYRRHKNLHVYTQKNQKLPRALTHLHALATGDFITWTSADNVMHPQMIEKLVEKLMACPDAALVYGDVALIGADGKPYYGNYRDTDRDYKTPRIIRLLRDERPLSLGDDNYINASFLYRRECSELLGGVYADDLIGAEDYDYWLRLEKSGKIVHLCSPTPYYFYRVHDNSMSHVLETEKLKQHLDRLGKLRAYEQERRAWAQKRPNLLLEGKLPEEDALRLALESIAADIDAPLSEKDIVFSADAAAQGVRVGQDEYFLRLGGRDIARVFRGLSMPREAFRARNLYSHPAPSALLSDRRPVFGCHVSSAHIDPEDVRRIVEANPRLRFVFLDTSRSEAMIALSSKLENLMYLENTPYGTASGLYSDFARVIAFPTMDTATRMQNLLLAYATGRRLSDTDGSYAVYPFTRPFSGEFRRADAVSDADYAVMDAWLESLSPEGCLRRLLRFYNAATQELYPVRPAFRLDVCPEESAPVPVWSGEGR